MRSFVLPVFIFALPLLEIAGFVVVGRQIGALATVGLVLVSAMAGLMLLRHQGLGVMGRARAEIEVGRDPSRQIAHGVMILLAAFLLIVPGFLTDIAGLLLFIPPVRDLAWNLVKRRITVVSSFGFGASRREGRTIDLDAEDFSRHPNPESPWRRLRDD
ncbi:MAG: membrane protein FxsA [Proteobacteria bacterium]|nr:MAG: membrane protein FxsA [Pseudomonadota bacterium]